MFNIVIKTLNLDLKIMIKITKIHQFLKTTYNYILLEQDVKFVQYCLLLYFFK